MSPFALLTYAIIALIIAGLAVTLMLQFFPQNNVFDQIRDSIEISQSPSNYGQNFYTGKLHFTKDLIITKTALNITDVSLAVECNDPSICCPNGDTCSRAIEWDYEKLKIKQDRSIQVYTRCYQYFEELVCRVYFGKKPAQAEITDLEYINDNGTITSIIHVTNSGNAELTLGKNSLKVLKQVNEEWQDTENKYDQKEINLLVPGQEHSFVWETNLLTDGNYKLEFKFEGDNSGYDINSFEIFIGQNKKCTRDENKFEHQDYNGQVRTIRFCTGCNFGYECLAQWIEKKDGIDYEPYGKNSVYYLRNLFPEERCDRELENKIGYYSLDGSCITGYEIIPVAENNIGVCCAKKIGEPINVCETTPESEECLIDWIPQNPDYVCPSNPNISSFSKPCNNNEMVRPPAADYVPSPTTDPFSDAPTFYRITSDIDPLEIDWDNLGN